MGLFESMFTSPLAMWVYLGIIGVIGMVCMWLFLSEMGVFQQISDWVHDLKDSIHNKKKEQDVWNFNLFIMIFGGIAILFILAGESIQKWWRKHKRNVVLLLVNGAMLIPLFLLIVGVVEQLPEFYFILFVFYGLIMMSVVVARADKKRSGYQHHYSYNYNDQFNHISNNSPHTTHKSTYKHIPSGLTASQAKKKKDKIREKLMGNEYLQKKYNL